MNRNRQAVTPILSTIILISISLVLIATVSSYYLGISHGSLGCEIQSVQIFEISNNIIWGSVQFFNNGEYAIQEYSIAIHDGTQKITAETNTDVNISPKEIIVKEFEITQNLSSEHVIVEVFITNQDSTFQCTQEAKL